MCRCAFSTKKKVVLIKVIPCVAAHTHTLTVHLRCILISSLIINFIGWAVHSNADSMPQSPPCSNTKSGLHTLLRVLIPYKIATATADVDIINTKTLTGSTLVICAKNYKRTHTLVWIIRSFSVSNLRRNEKWFLGKGIFPFKQEYLVLIGFSLNYLPSFKDPFARYLFPIVGIIELLRSRTCYILQAHCTAN